MDRLRRGLAPVSDEAWALIDEEAARALRHFLAARALVDFSGPNGWAWSAAPRGRVTAVDAPTAGVAAARRVVTEAVELRTAFSLDRSVVDAVDRGSDAPDLDEVTEAARLAARAENDVVFNGGSGFEGIGPASPHEAVALTDSYGEYPRHVARAVARLRKAGVEGPYGIALGDRCFTGVIETTEHGGYPVLEHIRLVLGGPVIWAPEVDGALVVSMRGGDFELVCGEDFAVGYQSHDATSVGLYLEQSLAFLVHEPKAAVALRYA